jgi:hypothetical protein
MSVPVTWMTNPARVSASTGRQRFAPAAAMPSTRSAHVTGSISGGCSGTLRTGDRSPVRVNSSAASMARARRRCNAADHVSSGL